MKSITFYAIAIFDELHIREDAGDESPMPKKVIAGNLNISVDYVEQIMGPMIAYNIVESYRGRHGGFKIVRKGISALDILNAMEPDRATRSIFGEPAVISAIRDGLELVQNEYLKEVKLS